MTVYEEWILAKETEDSARRARLDIESQLVSMFNVPLTHEGTANFERDGYKVKVVGRMNRKVNTDLVRQIAIENGLEDHLPHLFRWSADINSSAWKATDSSITNLLSEGIETKPGKPGITVERL